MPKDRLQVNAGEETLLNFTDQVMLLTVFGGVAVVMAIESLQPLRPVGEAPHWRWLNNLALTVVDYAVLLGLTPLLSLMLAPLLGAESVGLLERLQLPFWAAFLLVLLSLQLVSYWLHRAMHSVPMLWRIHAVHHCDTEVDATTAFRHHPIEVLLGALVSIPVILLLLPDPLILLIYNILHATVAVIHHGNISFGPRITRTLGLLVVTPDFHRLHHAAERRFTDSNYASILPLFDHVFRTATSLPAEQQKSMRLGLDYLREVSNARLIQMLLIPFKSGFGQSATKSP